MCFAHIDGDELNLIGIALLQLFEDPELGSKGASGEAAEDQDDWFLFAKR